jgi:Domain of unknown function (DUF5615)
MRFYLDESFSDKIVVAARRLGVDVTSSHATGNDGWPDDIRLHAGILLLPRSLPPTRDNFAASARALQDHSKQHLHEDYHHVGWLYPAA